MERMYISGSGEIPLAALLFFKDGSMALSASDCPDAEKDSLLLVTDFFVYSLSRDDWMTEYIGQIKKDRYSSKKEKRSQFRVIQGGVTGSVQI